LVRFFHSLAETETLLKTAAHPRYQLEIGLVKLMEMRRLEPLNQLLERLAALEESLRTGKASAGSSGTQASRGTASAASAGAKPPPASSLASSVSRSAPAASAPWSAASHLESGTGLSKTAASSGAAAESYSAAATKTALASEVSSPGLSEADPATASEPASDIEQIKTALGTRRKMLLVTALDAARQASIEGNELCLEFAPETRTYRDTLAKSDNI